MMKLNQKKMDKIINNYFLYFSKKNIDKLNLIFSTNIQLVDWTIKLKGKKNVLDFNKNLFKKFKKINIRINEKFYNFKKNSVACALTIKLDSKKIHVIDLICLNSKFKIKKIIAYLR